MEELHARVETHLKLRRLQIDLEEYSRHLESARARLKLDLEFAREVQRGFLPRRLPVVPAGHPSPLIYHRATRAVGEAASLQAVGLPLGVQGGFVYESCQVSLEPGDCILTFSDGVTEAMDVNNIQLGTKGVYAAVQ